MPELKQNPTLKDIQSYVADLERERNFSDQSVIQKCLLLGEEVGELFKAIRKQERLSVDVTAKISSADEEIADILIMICSVANRLDIDIEAAFRHKESINMKRKWA